MLRLIAFEIDNQTATKQEDKIDHHQKWEIFQKTLTRICERMHDIRWGGNLNEIIITWNDIRGIRMKICMPYTNAGAKQAATFTGVNSNAQLRKTTMLRESKSVRLL